MSPTASPGTGKKTWKDICHDEGFEYGKDWKSVLRKAPLKSALEPPVKRALWGTFLDPILPFLRKVNHIWWLITKYMPQIFRARVLAWLKSRKSRKSRKEKGPKPFGQACPNVFHPPPPIPLFGQCPIDGPNFINEASLAIAAEYFILVLLCDLVSVVDWVGRGGGNPA